MDLLVGFAFMAAVAGFAFLVLLAAGVRRGDRVALATIPVGRSARLARRATGLRVVDVPPSDAEKPA